MSRGCFHNCDEYGCDFIITWKYLKWLEAIEFTMAMKLKDPYKQSWFALGLSDDKQMVKLHQIL